MEEYSSSAEIKYQFSGGEIRFAWACLFLGYLFFRTVPIASNPLGGLIFIMSLYILSAGILAVKKRCPAKMSVIAACVSLVMGIVPVVTESRLLVNIAYGFALLSYCYAVSAAFGNTLEKGCSNCLPLDCFQAVFVIPFFSIFKLFSALYHKKFRSCWRLMGKVAAGILLALIPAAMVTLLLSYDAGFSKIMRNIWSVPEEEVQSHLASLLLGMPLAMYLFGLYLSSSQNKVWSKLTARSAQQGLQKVRRLSRLTAAVAVVPVLAVYVIFFLSQFQYYISGFTGVLPEGFSYARYAREGFFQLCAVSVINLVILLAVTLFTRRKVEKADWTVRLICTVLCLFTLILIATAAAKLWLYIGSYGLTHKRIYAMWLMVLIGIIYLVITVGQFAPKLKTVFVSVCVCVLMFGALSLCNVSRITADYNVDRYLDGSLQSVDVSLLEELGDSAVPAMVRLAEATQEDTDRQELYTELDDTLQRKIRRLERKDRSVFAFAVYDWQAEKALKEYGK